MSRVKVTINHKDGREAVAYCNLNNGYLQDLVRRYVMEGSRVTIEQVADPGEVEGWTTPSKPSGVSHEKWFREKYLCNLGRYVSDLDSMCRFKER